MSETDWEARASEWEARYHEEVRLRGEDASIGLAERARADAAERKYAMLHAAVSAWAPTTPFPPVPSAEYARTWDALRDALDLPDKVSAHTLPDTVAALTKRVRDAEATLAALRSPAMAMASALVEVSITDHAGDEETGAHDEDCQACALDAARAAGEAICELLTDSDVAIRPIKR